MIFKGVRSYKNIVENFNFSYELKICWNEMIKMSIFIVKYYEIEKINYLLSKLNFLNSYIVNPSCFVKLLGVHYASAYTW